MRLPLKVVIALALAAGAAEGAAAERAAGGELRMYTATVDYGVVAKLRGQGYDIARVRRIPASTQAQIELVLRRHEVAKLEAQGIALEPWPRASPPKQ